MYLARADIEATLRAVEARSAPGSRLVILYTSPSLLRTAVGFLLGLIGEPFRSQFTEDQMRALLVRFRFAVDRDDDLARIAARMGMEPSRLLEDMRIVTATLR